MNRLDLLTIPLEGTHLIEASAGTGKTYTIASLFVRLILEQSFHVREILVVTYTEAATDELKTRVRDKIHAALSAFERGSSDDPFLMGLIGRHGSPGHAVETLELALRRFDEAAIFTIHGFCRRILSEMPFESQSPFSSELITDQTGLLRETVGDFYRAHFSHGMPPELVHYASRRGYTFGALLNLVKGAGIEATVIPEDTEAPDPGPLLEETRRAFARLGQAWALSGQEVLRLLLDDPGLNHSKYRPGTVRRICAGMDVLAASETLTLPLFDHFDKLTPSLLEAGVKNGFAAPEHEVFTLCGELKSCADRLEKVFDAILVRLKAELFSFVRKSLRERKEALSVVHFDDLLLKVRDALSSGTGEVLREVAAQHYRAALIDEFQDTDPIQYEIFKAFFSDTTLFLIGDPKQAIYSFRGADIFTYLNASGQVREEARHTLETNWRTDPVLLDTLNHVFDRPLPFVFDEIAFEPVAPADMPGRETLLDTGAGPLTFWFLPGNEDRALNRQDAEKRISLAVAWEVTRLLGLKQGWETRDGYRPVKPNDIALIVRKNSQGRTLKEVLTFCGVPCVICSDENIFDTPEAFDMEILLRGVAQPHAEPLIRAALAGPLFGLDAHALDALLGDGPAFETWIERFSGYHELWATTGFMRMFRKVLADEDVRARLLDRPRGERMLTNILHLSEILNAWSVKEKLGMRGLIKRLNASRDPAASRSEEHQLRLESDGDAVRIITVHKSKGLEFPIVFCPFLWGSSKLHDRANVAFHDPGSGYKAFFDVGSDGIDMHRAAAEKELLSEDMRLVYVALTRAKSRCYLVWARPSQGKPSALSYLLHQRNGHDTSPTEPAQPLAALDDNALMAGLKSLCASRETAICLQDIPTGTPGRFERTRGQGTEIFCREFTGRIDRSWRVTSFSSMVSGAHTLQDADRDALMSVPDPAGDHSGEQSIFSFPKGAGAGTMIHRIFELVDFQADDDAVRSLVAKVLQDHGFEERWTDVMAGMVRKVLSVPMGDFTLSSVMKGQTLRELEFYLPVDRVSPGILAGVFQGHGGGEVPEGFPQGLRFDESTGFIRGFIDLVLCSGEKYYLLDWKSNFLGSRVEDYDRQRLDRAMEENRYILQYHLYALALHRYLMKRLKGYSYARHFGGALYVFVRGVDPEKGPQFGICRRMPSEGLIERLNDVLIPVRDDVTTGEGHELGFG